ncbi:HAD family hydrolase [Bradyrhizobium macuxiense]|uniref:HAD family hydrolase n=1 Tax=Bradyrhizobium macuxiense TaxID=1755647 RepID=A0A109JGL1_9BRAD|nr:HAD-IA family hydrolase [Bradyrhizobium macuxiense]KWV48463.1 HAD family hydrolase [Bradyrhizobium macuxiense]
MNKALVLDFGGVISRTMFETHDDNEKALGLAPGTLQWRGPFDPENDTVWRNMQAGKISERDYWTYRMKETAALVGENWTEFSVFVGRVRGADPNSAIRPEARDAIETAHKAGAKLAILSNELDLFYGAELRKKLGFLDKFDTIVDATYTGILKPDPRAYGFVTDALKLAPEDCIFVDDQQKNILGAEAFGMTTVFFDVTRPRDSYVEALRLLGIESMAP